MNRWEQSSAGSTRVSAKLPDDLKEAFSAVCDDMGRTMTDVLVEQMAEVVREHRGADSADPLPDDDRLRKGYLKLRRECNPFNGTIDCDVAESAAAEATQVPKRSVRAAVLDPLRSDGWIEYNYGTVIVLEVGR